MSNLDCAYIIWKRLPERWSAAGFDGACESYVLALLEERVRTGACLLSNSARCPPSGPASRDPIPINESGTAQATVAIGDELETRVWRGH